jgi:hypothetical protein
MVKMEICSNLEDQQISKLNEYSLVAYRIWKTGRDARLGFGKFKSKKLNLGGGVGAKALRPECKDVPSATNGSFEPSTHDHRGSLLAPSSSTPESSLRIQETNADLASTNPTAPNESGNTQAPSKGAKAAATKSNEESREGLPRRSSSSIKHREVLSRLVKEVVGAPGSSSLVQVPPKNPPSLFSSDISFQNTTGQGGSLGTPSTIAKRHVTSGKLSAIEEKNSRESSDPEKGSNTNKHTLPSPTLITHLSKGPRKSVPKGADLQGPSPIDHGLELEAEFPHEMVSEMQNNAATKARRMVIGRTLGGRLSFKALHECLKLHLLATYASTTLLTCGYFLIAFENEEGAIATRKLTTVDWSGLSLSFSRFSLDFDSSAQGAKALLTHTIKV